MPETLIFILYLIATFLFAGIPTGYLIVKAAKGIDIRKEGSGNIGATNVKRVMGTRWFITVLLLDAIKGALPGTIALIFLPFSPAQLPFVALFTILGNVFSPYLGFKGGKGVATAIGALGVLSPLALLFSFILFTLVLLLTNYVSLGSILAAFAFPFFVLLAGMISHKPVHTATIIFCSIIAVVIIIMHKKNIRRIMHGEENKFFQKK
jgi:glycerol-3-phosphate acyltransferase PlsY